MLKDVYEFFENVFVGGFIGLLVMNFFKGKLMDGFIKIGFVVLIVLEGKMKVLCEKGYIGKEVIFGICFEDIYDELVVVELYKNFLIKVKINVVELFGFEIMIYL